MQVQRTTGRPQHPAGLQQEGDWGQERVAHQLHGGGKEEKRVGSLGDLSLWEGWFVVLTKMVIIWYLQLKGTFQGWL